MAVGTVRQASVGTQDRASRAGQHSLIISRGHSKPRALSKAWAMHHFRLHLEVRFMTALHWRGGRELGPQSGGEQGCMPACW